MQHKYPALFTITSVFRVFGWVTVIWTAALVIMGAIVTFVNGQYLGVGFFGFLGELLGAVCWSSTASSEEPWLFCISRQQKASRFSSTSREIPVPSRIYSNKSFYCKWIRIT